MAKLVSKTYGDALFAAGMEEGSLEFFYDAAQVVATLLREHGEFGKLMVHPKITKEEKTKVLTETFENQIPKEILGMLTLLVNKGHAGDMLPVFEYFIGLVKQEKKIGEARVTTAIALDNAQKAKIEQKLLETTEFKTLEMQYIVDAALIGGMVIRIGDRVVDSSIQTKLQNLSRDLRNVQV